MKFNFRVYETPRRALGTCMRLIGWFLCLIASVSLTLRAATNIPREQLEAAEETYELRLKRILNTKGHRGLVAHLAAEIKTQPQPYVKAWYANYLLYAAEFGLPDLADAPRGFALAKESADEGSLFGLELAGRAYGDGRGVERSPPRAIEHLNEAAARDRHTAMAELGKFHFFGYGLTQNRVVGEIWIRAAANRGAYGPLVQLASWWENPQYVGVCDLGKAQALYYEAGQLGSEAARQLLRNRAKSGDQEAQKYVHLDLVVSALTGYDALPSQLKAAVKWLEANAAPDDIPVQLALAEAMKERTLAVYDVASAKAKIARAVAAGSDDARALQAELAWRGIGQATDQAGAVKVWQALALKANGRALNRMGWLHWWGNGEKFGVAKDAAKTFKLCKESADLGYVGGQLNVAECYAHGIGVPKNYFRAAKYYGILEDRRYKNARVMKERILAMVKG